MINYSDEEIRYIMHNYQEAIDFVNGKDIFNGEYDKTIDYKLYMKQQNKDIYNQLTYCINNISKINGNKNINEKITMDIVYWFLGIWVWLEDEWTKEEVYYYVNDKVFCDLWEKVKNEFNREDLEN
jgi:hypothetical protein